MNQTANIELLKKQTFGVEYEMTNISQRHIINVCAKILGCENTIATCIYDHDGTTLRGYKCVDSQGRKWLVVGDGSISSTGEGSGEFVTPPLHYEDIELLQKIIRQLREEGAKSGARYGCGIHIHVGADIDKEDGQTPKSLRNLVNLMNSHEPLMFTACKCDSYRQQRWARIVDESFLRAINRKKPSTLEQFKHIWYTSQGWSDISTARGNHYHDSRYHALNLHNIWLKMLTGELEKATIEFRLFECHKSIHCGELKAYIQLCLAICSYVKLIDYCRPNRINTDNEKYALKNWLNNLGLIGEEFKTCRKMLLKYCTGDSASKVRRVSGVNNLDDLGIE